MKAIYHIPLLCCLVLSLQGCKTTKNFVNEDTHVSDSVATEYIEKVVEVPVTVYVEVPVEKQERETTDTTSTLETSFAISNASICWEGDIPILYHSLENKAQHIKKETTVPVKEKTIIKTRYKTITKTVTVTKEKQFSFWDKLKVGLRLLLILGCLLALVFVIKLFFRK